MIWNSRSARLMADLFSCLFSRTRVADADSMLAAGGRYNGTTPQLKGICHDDFQRIWLPPKPPASCQPCECRGLRPGTAGFHPLRHHRSALGDGRAGMAFIDRNVLLFAR